MNTPTKPIRLGIDMGNSVFRAAYVYPDDERSVVSVPIPLSQFQSGFPLCERLHTNEVAVSRFFPSISQRLERDFRITFGGVETNAFRMVSDMLRQTVETARTFSGLEVGSVVLTLPHWLSSEGRAFMRDALAAAGISNSVLIGRMDAAAASFRADLLGDRKSATALVLSAGYVGATLGLVRCTSKGYRVMGQMSDQSMLAGNCIDFAIMQSTMQELKAERIPTAAGWDMRPTSLVTWSTFQERVAAAKSEAGESGEAFFDIPAALLPERAGDLRVRLSGARLLGLVNEHIDRLLAMLDELMSDVAVDPTEIEFLVMEGGSTYLPGVSERVRGVLANAAPHHVPQESLALGAARLAAEGIITDRLDAPRAGAENRFVPSLQIYPELVELMLPPTSGMGTPPAGPTASGGAAPGAPAARSPVTLAMPLDRVTLHELRQLALSDRSAARAALEALRSQIDSELLRIMSNGNTH